MGTLIGIGNTINTSAASGRVNLYADAVFAGNNWTNNGDGSYSHPVSFATVDTLYIITDSSAFIEGNLYEVIFDITARTGGAITPVVSNFIGTSQNTVGIDFTTEITAGAVPNNTGFRTNGLVTGLTLDNLRCFAL